MTTRRRAWQKWLMPDGDRDTKKKPQRVGEFELYDDGKEREKRAESIISNRSNLEDAASRLRLSGDGFCLHAATLVDAAIEALDAGLSNLCEDKPRRSPLEPEREVW